MGISADGGSLGGPYYKVCGILEFHISVSPSTEITIEANYSNRMVQDIYSRDMQHLGFLG